MSVSAITLPSFSGETAITVKASTETIKFFEESKQNRRLFALADEETMIQGKLKAFYQKYQKGLANRNNFFVNTIAQFTEVKSRSRRKPDYVSHKFKQILKNNDLREIRFHDLRHSCRNIACKERHFIKRNTRLAWTFKFKNY